MNIRLLLSVDQLRLELKGDKLSAEMVPVKVTTFGSSTEAIETHLPLKLSLDTGCFSMSKLRLPSDMTRRWCDLLPDWCPDQFLPVITAFFARHPKLFSAQLFESLRPSSTLWQQLCEASCTRVVWIVFVSVFCCPSSTHSQDPPRHKATHMHKSTVQHVSAVSLSSPLVARTLTHTQF